MKNKKYLLLLKKACNIFEPNDPEFIRVSHRVYEVINDNRDYDQLHSTRFFGPMIFYLTWNKKLDNLISTMINNSNLDECLDYIRLYLILHGESAKTSKLINDKTPPEEIIEVKQYKTVKKNFQLIFNLIKFRNLSKMTCQMALVPN